MNPNRCPECYATIRWVETEQGKKLPCNPVLVVGEKPTHAARKTDAGRFIGAYQLTARRPVVAPGFTPLRVHYADCRMERRRPQVGPRAVPQMLPLEPTQEGSP